VAGAFDDVESKTPKPLSRDCGGGTSSAGASGGDWGGLLSGGDEDWSPLLFRAAVPAAPSPPNSISPLSSNAAIRLHHAAANIRWIFYRQCKICRWVSRILMQDPMPGVVVARC
jgi:hypothetical protein